MNATTDAIDKTRQVEGVRHEGGMAKPVTDALTVEAPLHIRVNGVSFATTMRTPGADCLLVRGLLFTEGIVPDPGAPMSFHETLDPESGLAAALDVSVDVRYVAQSVEGRRSTLATASCGVCGTREMEYIEVYGAPLKIRSTGRLDPALIPRLRETMQRKQSAFAESGGCHGAAIFDMAGALLALEEDVGRHNAVDKAVGRLIEEGRLDSARILFVSGRVSYEIVYKAYRAGIPFLLAVSAPSTMAVETAQRFGITLAGFCREDRATVYANASRIATGSGP